MKKCFGLIAMALVLALFTAGCSKKTTDETAKAGAPGEVTMRLLTNASGIDDKSFNAAAWRGILEFYGDTWDNTPKRGSLYDVVAVQTEDMYASSLRQAANKGCDLIVTAGGTWADALAEVAKDNPNQKYMIVDVDWLEGANIMQAVYTEHEGSYLAGAAAALKAKGDNIPNPRFGFIGGIPNAVITKFEVGYVQGILSVLPNAQIVDYYVSSWDEPALAKTQASNWYNSGVYAIYSKAGNSGSGIIAQAKEYRYAGRNVWAIGVDSDQHEEGLYTETDSAVLTSMLKKVETSLIYALNSVKDNTYKGEAITFDLAKDGVGYSTANAALSDSIKEELETLKQKIISGEIKIAPSYAEAKKLPGFPQNLKAVDD